MEGWPSQADRNRSDHLIFDVANDKQDPVPERATWIPDRVGHVSQLEPFPGLSELGCKALSGQSGFLWCWELIQIAQISPRAEGITPHVPEHHHPSSLPFELLSRRLHKSIWPLLGILLSPNSSISSWGGGTWKSRGRADFSSRLLCSSFSSSEDEQCQVDL